LMDPTGPCEESGRPTAARTAKAEKGVEPPTRGCREHGDVTGEDHHHVGRETRPQRWSVEFGS